MNARPESWSRPVEPGWAALATLLALALFLAAWSLLHVGFYNRDQVIDTPVYQRYGDAMVDGKVPYRDFAVEYPPGALPAFVLPSLVRSEAGDLEGFERIFEALMWLCGAAALGFMLLTLDAAGAGRGRIGAAVGFAAVSPLLVGSVVLTRFDLLPAALTVGALAGLVSGRERLGLGALGLAAATKIYPVVLLPVALAYVWRRHGRREAGICSAAFVAVVLLCFAPFLVLAPGGVLSSLSGQAGRPLQIESLGSGILLVSHQLFGFGIEMESGHGSQNLVGIAPAVLAVLLTLVQAGALVGTWVWFARGPADRERLIRASAASVVAFVALGKVLSPQFLIWLVPLVPLVRGRRGLAATGVLALALALTQTWFPFRYWELALEFDAWASWGVLARDVTLVGLLALLLWPPKRAQGRPTARPAAATSG
ncbi:MAG: glycosyltransferase 87 family protein [Gaiellaceae bacterium]